MKEFRQYIEILIKITLTVLKEKSQCTQKSFTIVICRYGMLILLCFHVTKQETVR